METKIKASNIKCAGCVNAITKALVAVENVKAVNVDIPSNEITIESDMEVDLNKIRQKLSEIGYPEHRELIK